LYLGNADVLYNKFDTSTSSFPPEGPPLHTTTDYRCVVATTTSNYWKLAQCMDLRRVVCQTGL